MRGNVSLPAVILDSSLDFLELIINATCQLERQMLHNLKIDTNSNLDVVAPNQHKTNHLQHFTCVTTA